MSWLTTKRQWLVIPGFEGLVGEVDFIALVLALNLIELHGKRLKTQRFNRPLASGGLMIGTPANWLRVIYLIEQQHFLLEKGGDPSVPLHSSGPVTFDVLPGYLATWLYTNLPYGITLKRYKSFAASTRTDAFWTQAYRELLHLPTEPLPEPPPRTPEQQKNDVLIRLNQQRTLLPEIERLEAKLREHLNGPQEQIQHPARRKT